MPRGTLIFIVVDTIVDLAVQLNYVFRFICSVRRFSPESPERFRLAAELFQTTVGCAVSLKWTTRLRSCSSTMKRCKMLKLTVGAVRKSMAAISPA